MQFVLKLFSEISLPLKRRDKKKFRTLLNTEKGDTLFLISEASYYFGRVLELGQLRT